MTLKYISLLTSWYAIYYYIRGVPVSSQNLINDYFYRVNGSVSVQTVLHSISKIQCASKCNLDKLCEGFWSYKDEHFRNKCEIFNISSTECYTENDKTTFIKTTLVDKFYKKCSSNGKTDSLQPTTEQSTTQQHTTSKHSDITATQLITISQFQQTSGKLTAQNIVLTTMSDYCKVDAAVNVAINNEIWFFIGNYIQIYSSMNDLTSLNFRKENIVSIFPEIKTPVDAGYFDGTNTIIIKGQTTHIYDTTNKQLIKSSTSSHFGYRNVPETIDAVLQKQDGTKFLFSDNTVLSLEKNGNSTFRIDNNGNKNFFKAKNHKERPVTITAAFNDNDLVMYMLSEATLYTFSKGKQSGYWSIGGQVVCN